MSVSVKFVFKNGCVQYARRSGRTFVLSQEYLDDISNRRLPSHKQYFRHLSQQTCVGSSSITEDTEVVLLLSMSALQPTILQIYGKRLNYCK
jgi:hypothetical protein